jgi:ATP-dependent RNA helicase DHX37/DHR1
VRSAEHVAAAAHGGAKRTRAVRYRVACLEDVVFLHPRSAMHATAPEYLVYGELLRTEKRPYMTGACVLRSAAIFLP